jgi:hypothetical protein
MIGEPGASDCRTRAAAALRSGRTAEQPRAAAAPQSDQPLAGSAPGSRVMENPKEPELEAT